MCDGNNCYYSLQRVTVLLSAPPDSLRSLIPSLSSLLSSPLLTHLCTFLHFCPPSYLGSRHLWSVRSCHTQSTHFRWDSVFFFFYCTTPRSFFKDTLYNKPWEMLDMKKYPPREREIGCMIKISTEKDWLTGRTDIRAKYNNTSGHNYK